MTKAEYGKIVERLMDSDEVDELVKKTRESGTVMLALYSFAMKIGEKICDD